MIDYNVKTDIDKLLFMKDCDEEQRIKLYCEVVPDILKTDKVLKTLKDLKYFKLPASINHHTNFEGGLFYHSCLVFNALTGLTKDLHLNWEREESPAIVAFLHDLCKCVFYTNLDMPKGKFKNNDNTIYSKKQHGATSVMLCQQLITLTYEELSCILHHMGAYDTDNWNGLDFAIKLYPNVLYTHVADMIASKLLEDCED